jgi:hypothetical protein
MVAFFFFGLVGVFLVLLGAPVVLAVLMLETCNQRRDEKTSWGRPRSRRRDSTQGPVSTFPLAAL